MHLACVCAFDAWKQASHTGAVFPCRGVVSGSYAPIQRDWSKETWNDPVSPLKVLTRRPS